jgi:exopolyphosphatase/guanosine-5'-triphosphate,3'-diphosphate pyrophosphatase
MLTVNDSFFPRTISGGPIIAAIDLGTNSCRLLVARVEGQSFHIIDSFSRVVCLGENVHTTNRLSEEAIDRTLVALKICKEKIVHNKVTALRAVTTEACRRAVNRDDLIRRARTEMGLHVEIITPEEEARLALSGCAGVLNTRVPYAIAFDIGGGSTEVMWLSIKEPRRLHRRRFPIIDVIDCISLPYGVVTLSDQYENQSYDEKIYQEIRETVSSQLRIFSKKNGIDTFAKEQRVQMVGTSGTVTTLAAMSLGLEKYDRKAIDGIFLEAEDAHRISQEIFHMDQSQRAYHPCIGRGRTDMVVMGTAILEGIFDTWSIPKLRVADRGVREGILMELIRNMNPRWGNAPKFL